MIKIEIQDICGVVPAMHGMRNPLNSWEKNDTSFSDGVIHVGVNDMTLAEKLSKSGPSHRKYLRMINLYVDITAPLYWWKEFDTYKVGTVANSCSTMHKIQAKRFEESDFSLEHLTPENQTTMSWLIDLLENIRQQFLLSKDKKYWWQMIQMLPSSYNQKRTVMINYETLANIYHTRKNHKLDEWHTMCDFIETLPLFEAAIKPAE